MAIVLLQKEKQKILEWLSIIGEILDKGSEDCGRYIKMAMGLEPNDGKNLIRYASWLQQKQKCQHIDEMDWSFLDYYRKGVELETNPGHKLLRIDIFWMVGLLAS